MNNGGSFEHQREKTSRQGTETKSGKVEQMKLVEGDVTLWLLCVLSRLIQKDDRCRSSDWWFGSIGSRVTNDLQLFENEFSFKVTKVLHVLLAIPNFSRMNSLSK